MPFFKDKTTLFLLALLALPASARAGCQKEFENLCVMPGVDLSKISEAPQVLEAAKAYAIKMKPYGKVLVTSGYRSAAGQRAKIASGVQAGPASGRNMSAHIYGAALDLQIKGGAKLTRATCDALVSVMPLLKAGGGVIHEGCGGGSCDVHIDDNWGKRFWGDRTVMYASHGNCSAGIKSIGKGAFVSTASPAPAPLPPPPESPAAPEPPAPPALAEEVTKDNPITSAAAPEPEPAPPPAPVAKPKPAPSASANASARNDAYRKKIQSQAYQRELATRRAIRARQRNETTNDIIRRALGQ
ncbi:MAG TPA: hypothetical protein VIH99_00030 [Bdellovibrionota bacterium]|jgi:hypothetical protein